MSAKNRDLFQSDNMRMIEDQIKLLLNLLDL